MYIKKMNMSSAEAKFDDVYKNIKKHHGGLAIVAKVAGHSNAYVGKSLSDEKRRTWKSTKRIMVIAIRVTNLLDYVKQYDQAQLAEELAEQEA